MNAVDIIILAVVGVALIAAVVLSVKRRKKKGGCSCGCGCCSSDCPAKKQNKTK